MDEINKHLDALSRRKEWLKGPCPDPERLAAYCLGQLDEAAAELFLDHVTLCDRCRDQVLASKNVAHPFSWERFKNTLRTATVHAPTKIYLYINGALAAEQAIDDKGVGRLKWTAASGLESIEIKDERGNLLDYIDPDLYGGPKIESKINLTDRRQLITEIELQKDRADLRLYYRDRSQPVSLVKRILTALPSPSLLRIPAYGALALLLILVPFWLKERTGMNDRLQEMMANYERQLTDLRRQSEQLGKESQNSQAEIAELKRLRQEPQLAASLYQAVPTIIRMPGRRAEPLSVQFSETIKSISLAFFFSAQDYKTYQVEIYDSEGKQRLWVSPEQPIVIFTKGADEAMFTLTLNEGFITPGKYQLRIYGRSQQRKLIAEYPLHITS